MSDYLLGLSRNPLAKRLVRQLKLPIPMPETLRRTDGLLQDEPLSGQTLALGVAKASPLTPVLTTLLTQAGATLADSALDLELNGLVFDATALASPADLGSVYEFIKPRLAALVSCGRIVLVSLCPTEGRTPEQAAAAQALVGFAKSLAKEVGKRGATCQVLQLAANAEPSAHLAGPLRFFLSSRSAFVSGQVVRVSGDVAPAPLARLDQPLTGKVALVTGAAHGIGHAIALRLASAGARVIGLDRPQEKEALAALCTLTGGASIEADLLDPNAPREIVRRLEAEDGQLDILVNNAGITRDKTLARMSKEWWDQTLTINLTAPMRLTDAFVSGDGSELIKLLNPNGRIIFMSSVAGIAGNYGQTNYAAAKAGVIGYIGALAPRVAARGITVNALAPGFIETRMTASMPMAVREVARRFNALSQGGTPEDVADAALFLASPEAAGVSGSVLRVCGLNLIGA